MADLSSAMRWVLDALRHIQKKLPHPVVGIVIATFVAFAGRGELVLRSWGMLFIVVWLTVDLWVWLLPKRDTYRVKYAIGWTVTSLMLIAVMGIMWWWLNGKLEDQRDDVYQHLAASHSIPPGSEDDPMNTMFTITNNGSYEISDKHQILCNTHLAVGVGGTSTIRGFVSGISSQGTKFNILGGGLDREHFPIQIASTTPIAPGGDAQTEPCLSAYHFTPGTECADVTIIFWYALETQPDLEQEKDFHFIALKTRAGGFSWYTEPVESKRDYCGRYVQRGN